MDKMRFISVLKCKHTHFEADEKTGIFNYSHFRWKKRMVL